MPSRLISVSLPRGVHSSFAKKMASFLLGLSVSTGVVYAFTVGNTPVYIGYCMAAVIFLLLFLRRSRSLMNALFEIDRSILVFVGIAALSLIPSLAYAISGNLGIDAPVTVIKGLVVLVVGVIVYVTAVSLRGYRRAIIAGVSAGILVNVVFSLIAQSAFEAGTVFSLISLFPQDAFVVPLQWGVPEPAGSHAIYTFRAQGLFLEPSHLMVFLVAWSLLCATSARRTFVKAAMMVGVVYLSARTLSPNAVILIVELVALFVVSGQLKDGRSRYVQRRKTPHAAILAIAVLLFAAVLFLVLFGDAVADTLGMIVSSLSDLDVTSSADTGTAERFESMLATLSILPRYPFGAGWNTESLVLTAGFGESTFASHSFALRLLLEAGLPGFLAYCWVIWRHATGAFRSSKQGRFVAIAVVCMAIAQFMNGITLLPYVWLLLGLAKGIEMERADDKGRRAKFRLHDRAEASERKS